ncbi:hypothetical protein MLD38_038223 [Melastoma candidum]|uniref:Uncharacterized protein n=1 Tax=Melastoma candidum TaxID=119954 RepID=A0ACB9KY96_9MYRT|nr:hypothetical protein MLD38_038223 [Melastoma candidum]
MDSEMDTQENANSPPPPPPPQPLSAIKQQDSPPPSKVTPVAAAIGVVPCGSGGDRLKRDEWSEGAVSTLLEAYEAKWITRNRAKLKGHDWEDVARLVSSRGNGTKSPKTQTQCKNKIESMKKRYRSESAIADSSSWPLYPRLDMLLRGTLSPNPVSSQQPASTPPPLPPQAIPFNPQPQAHPLLLLDPPLVVVSQSPVMLPGSQLPLPPPPALPNKAQNSQESNGADRVVATVKEDGIGLGAKPSDRLSDKDPLETDSSTPALYSDKQQNSRSRPKTERKGRRRKRRVEEWEIAESIRWLADVVVRSEQSRMETMKEMERMRMEAEARRGEMELKRTEIVANTQLEIARIFAATVKGIDPSLRIGRS